MGRKIFCPYGTAQRIGNHQRPNGAIRLQVYIFLGRVRVKVGEETRVLLAQNSANDYFSIASVGSLLSPYFKSPRNLQSSDLD